MSEIYAEIQDPTTPLPSSENKGGRPSKYDTKYCEEIITFFDQEPYEDKELTHFGKNGEVSWVDYKRMANKLPTLRSFAKHIGVNVDTVYEWIKVHQEFSEAFTHAKDLQKWFLIENGLNGCYNPAFAIFTAKNITDMRDKQEVTNELVGELQKDGTRRPFELFVNVGGGFIPANITLPTTPAGSIGSVTVSESAEVQGSSVASEGSQNLHSLNGVGQAGTS